MTLFNPVVDEDRQTLDKRLMVYKNTTHASVFKNGLNEWPGRYYKCSSFEMCNFYNIWKGFVKTILFYTLAWIWYLDDVYIYIYVYVYIYANTFVSIPACWHAYVDVFLYVCVCACA